MKTNNFSGAAKKVKLYLIALCLHIQKVQVNMELSLVKNYSCKYDGYRPLVEGPALNSLVAGIYWRKRKYFPLAKKTSAGIAYQLKTESFCSFA
jgi:hypothetical protein